MLCFFVWFDDLVVTRLGVSLGRFSVSQEMHACVAHGIITKASNKCVQPPPGSAVGSIQALQGCEEVWSYVKSPYRRTTPVLSCYRLPHFCAEQRRRETIYTCKAVRRAEVALVCDTLTRVLRDAFRFGLSHVGEGTRGGSPLTAFANTYPYMYGIYDEILLRLRTYVPICNFGLPSLPWLRAVRKDPLFFARLSCWLGEAMDVTAVLPLDSALFTCWCSCE